MEIVNIMTPKEFKIVKRIIHLADIHIRLYKRTEEYIHVFENLYSQLKDSYQDGDIIVIAGDLHHAKIEMTPESISLMADFLTNLGNIAPTIVIAGNHDANLNNIKRMDAITPIIQTLNHKNVFYFKNTGLYKFGENVVFSVMGVFEPTTEYINAKDIPEEYVKIALYHGPVQGSKTDTGYTISSNKIDISAFNGYDIVILGDIHKRQSLQEYEIESMNIDESELQQYLDMGWKVKKEEILV